MKLSQFDFNLPEELIAQEALTDRSASRLLVLNRETGKIEHSVVKNLGKYLRPGDLLVMNNSKVMPARLLGKVDDSLEVECFLLKRLNHKQWQALVKPGKKIGINHKIICQRNEKILTAEVKDKLPDGKVLLEMSGLGDLDELLEQVGHVPLPPYIKRQDNLMDKSRYQTVYAKTPGSVAAPTAGLHFTPELLEELNNAGIETVEITLHVGYGTFKPVRVENIEEHTIDPEAYEISASAAEKINNAVSENRRVITVGTTSTRTLEAVALANGGKIVPGAGTANLFIYPGFKFQIISGLLTNFHLPKSSLLMLVTAFGGKELVLEAYNQAIQEKYRFYSYGDAMLII